MKLIKISIILSKELSSALVDDLYALGVRQLFVQAGRTSILEKTNGISNFLNRSSLSTYPVEIISLFVDEKYEDSLMSYVTRKYDLKTPGKGSIYSQEIIVSEAHPDYVTKQDINLNIEQKEKFFRQLMGIVCIVQRGEGDKINKIALNYGASVPATTHGEGSGVRDKLGLLRITIPAEKELTNLTISKHDAEAVMELYITQGKLDEPGRGFAYLYPIKQGLVNTKISRNSSSQAASVEQMISAIDSIKGGMEWRKSRLEHESNKRREFLSDLTEMDLVCEEGRGTALTEAAMSSGAPGATICKIRSVKLGKDLEMIRFIREICKMIVPTDKVEAITAALKATGCFEGEDKAMLYTLPVQKAFTYRAKEIKRIEN